MPFTELEEAVRLRPLNDLAAWFPLLATTGVPVPRTRVVRTDVELMDLLSGKTPEGYTTFLGRLAKAALDIGFPVFLRTGHTSNKHYWNHTCFVPSINDLMDHVTELVEFSAMCDLVGLPVETWVVREFLELDARFVAFHGMPVAVETRFFVADGQVQCHHPYWPEEAFKREEEKTTDWRRLLAETNEVTERELPLVMPWAERVAEVFQGWSVDFARSKTGVWYAIDMAVAAQSYHWPGCPNSKEDQE